MVHYTTKSTTAGNTFYPRAWSGNLSIAYLFLEMYINYEGKWVSSAPLKKTARRLTGTPGTFLSRLLNARSHVATM